MTDIKEIINEVVAHLKGAFLKPRDPKRIPIILGEIEKIWRSFPDFRLGQILVCAVGKDDLFNVDDKILIEQLKEWVEQVTE